MFIILSTMIRQNKNHKINTQAESFWMYFSPIFHVSVRFCVNKSLVKILRVEVIYIGPTSLRWLWSLGLSRPPKRKPVRSIPESIWHLNISPFYCRDRGK